MSFTQNNDKSIQMDKKQFQKMVFINNAIEDGWTIKKNYESDSYIFTKKHENRREIFQSDYLEKFIQQNALEGSTLLSTCPK